MLLLDARGQPLQFGHGRFDRAAGLLPSGGTHQWSGPDPPPSRTAGDGPHQIEIPQQGVDGRFRRGPVLGFQKQFRRVQNPLPDAWGRIAPGGVDLAGFPAAEPVPRERVGHRRTVVRVGARQRDQTLHRHMRRDPAVAHLLLHAFGKQLHQRQPARHPAHAAVEPAGQVLQAETEAVFQLGQQPSLFQGGLGFGGPHRPVQHQRVGFRHRPDDGIDRIAAQLPERHDPLEAIDHPVPVRLPGDRDDDDRRLLSGLRQRRQQPALPLPVPDAQVFIPAIQLVKLQRLGSRWHAPILEQAGTGIAPLPEEVDRQPLSHQSDRP